MFFFVSGEEGGWVTNIKRSVSFPQAKQCKQFCATLQENQMNI